MWSAWEVFLRLQVQSAELQAEELYAGFVLHVLWGCGCVQLVCLSLYCHCHCWHSSITDDLVLISIHRAVLFV